MLVKAVLGLQFSMVVSSRGGDIQQRVMVFERQVNPYFWEMDCLEAVETTVPIKVGLQESSQEALIAEFGEELVGKASRAWSILMNQISYQALADLISATGSPSKGWTAAFKRHYAPQAAAEKARLTQSWYSLRMKVGESPNEYFSQGCVLRSRLGTNGIFLPDIDANQHFVRHLSHVFGVQNNIWLASPLRMWCSARTGRWRCRRSTS